MNVKLPDIEWECVLQVRDPKDSRSLVVHMSQTAMTMPQAYSLCAAKVASWGYELEGSKITPAGREKADPVAAARPAVPALPYNPPAPSTPPAKVDVDDGFPQAYFTKYWDQASVVRDLKEGVTL
jgi:hypothetical protein